jgi:hypothetical protein
MSINLQYNYAQIDLETYQCIGVFTSSYEIPLPDYIAIPTTDDRYHDKYYNPSTDLWYEDAAFTIEATEINEMYHG